MFSAGVLLGFLCACTMLLFGDRGVLSSNSIAGDGVTPGFRKDFNLSEGQSGELYAAVMIGLALSAPTAAHLSRRWNALRLVGFGVALAAAGAAGTGLARNLPLLLVCRALVGVGCGPFISLAAPLIDDAAPPAAKSSYLGALFLCIPCGFALGFTWSSFVAAAYGWRSVFYVEAAVMAALAALALCLPRPNDVKRSESRAAAALGGRSFISGVKTVLKLPAVLMAMLALAMYNGAIGGLSFWGPKAARAIFNLEPSVADLTFGGVTVVTGALGTLGGGLALDALGSSVYVALLLCVLGVCAAAALFFAAFAASQGLWTFVPALALGEAAMFATAAPATAVLLWSVPPDVRPSALALSEILNHLLGDVPLPPLLGALQQWLGNWRLTMCACTAVLFAAAALFAAAKCMLQRSFQAVELESYEALLETGSESES